MFALVVKYRVFFMGEEMRKNSMKTAILLLVAVGLTGCSALSESLQAVGDVGRVTVHQSSFDGAKEVKMEPAWVAPESGMAQIRMGLNWSVNESTNLRR